MLPKQNHWLSAGVSEGRDFQKAEEMHVPGKLPDGMSKFLCYI